MGVAEDLAGMREAHPKFVYLDYEGLKARVDSKDADAVVRLMRSELDKVNDFAAVQWEVVSTELKKQSRKDVPESLLSLENLAEAIVQLDAYAGLMHRAFMGIVRQCSEDQETASCAWLAGRVENAGFRSMTFDGLLAQLGKLYAAWRKTQGKDDVAWADATGAAPVQSFFMPRTSAMPAKVALLKILEPDSRLVRIPTTSFSRSAGNFSHDFRQKHSHVYFDNEKGAQYAERYRRSVPAAERAPVPEASAAPLLQCSWLGESEKGTEVTVNVEDANGDKTTARISHGTMPALLAGTLDPAAAAVPGEQKALSSALAAIKDESLRPSVGASFLRSSFVLDAVEVFSVDEELVFRDESLVDQAGSAAGSAEGQLAFPGALLRLRMPAERAGALLDRLGELGLRPMPGFSLALHGTALLHRCLAVPLPPWIPRESLPTTATSLSSLVLQPVRKSEGSGTPAKPATKPPKPTATPTKPPATQAKPDKKLFVDVKTPMASERTVVRWFRSAVLLASLSGLLLAGEDVSARVNGGLLGLTALVLVALPLRQFLKRSEEFSVPEASQPKVDRTLPTVVGLMLAVVLTATLLVEGAFVVEVGQISSS